MARTGGITTAPEASSPRFSSWIDHSQIQIESQGITFEAPTYVPETYNVEAQKLAFNLSGFDPRIHIKDQIATDFGSQDVRDKTNTLEKMSFAMAVISILLCFVLIGYCYCKQNMPCEVSGFGTSDQIYLKTGNGHFVETR